MVFLWFPLLALSIEEQRNTRQSKKSRICQKRQSAERKLAKLPKNNQPFCRKIPQLLNSF